MSNEDKPLVWEIKWLSKEKAEKLYPRRRSVNVEEWRKQNGIPPMNQPKQEITGCAFFPKHDPAVLQAYAKKHKLDF